VRVSVGLVGFWRVWRGSKGCGADIAGSGMSSSMSANSGVIPPLYCCEMRSKLPSASTADEKGRSSGSDLVGEANSGRSPSCILLLS
jgi:hypothetical protein